MGKLAVTMLAVSIAGVWGLRHFLGTYFDTAYDWYILAGILFAAALIFPDDLIYGTWAMFKWTMRQADKTKQTTLGDNIEEE